MDDRIARIVFEINSTAFDDDCQPAISMMTAQRLIEDHVKIVRAEALREAAEEQIAAILERLRVADRLEANADRLAEALAKLADENNLPWTGVVVQEFARAALAAHEDLDGRA